MPYWARGGRVYHSGIGGTYRVNNGDPQCEDPDAPDAEDLEPDWDRIAEDREERHNRKYGDE